MKNISAINQTSALRDVALVALLAGVACLVPAMSHIIALPISALNPILIVLVIGMAFLHDRRFGYLLAVAMPVVSCLVTGMPTPLKAVCMIAEFSTVVAVSSLLISRWKAVPSIFVAIISGKIVYYSLKALVFAPAVLISTGWQWQLLSIAISVILFSVLVAKKR